MIIFKINFCTAQEIWFTEKQISPKVDLLFYFQMPNIPQNTSYESFFTLIIDLQNDEDKILQNFSKSVKYEVNRAEKKDELEVLFFINNIENSVIESFINDYNLFNDERGKDGINIKDFKKYRDSNNLILSCVRHKNNTIVWHSYIVKADRARLKTSSSLLETEDKEMRNLIGRANKWLHWQDIKYLKEKNFKIYDLGGWYNGESDKKLLGINKFKESFGGEKEISYNYVITNTLKGKVYLLLSKLKKSLKK